MPYETLLAEGRITRQAPQPSTIRELLLLAERDAGVADQTLKVDPDWAFNIAYNAVLQAARTFMMKQSFRPRGPDQHAPVVSFLKEALGNAFVEEVPLSTRCGESGIGPSKRQRVELGSGKRNRPSRSPAAS